MKLRFYARGDLKPFVPGYRPMVGNLPRYVGRTVKVVDGVATHPAENKAHEVDADSDAGRRLAKMARFGDIWCADRETAAACSTEFVPVKFADGEWVPDVKPAAKAKE